jgi:hypothetical protein
MATFFIVMICFFYPSGPATQSKVFIALTVTSRKQFGSDPAHPGKPGPRGDFSCRRSTAKPENKNPAGGGRRGLKISKAINAC